MAEAYYIRVPVDDLEQPHWRCLQAEDGGDGAIVLALRLRGLAAKCNHGGLIVRHTGEPMPLLQLATYLGYTPQHLEHRLRLLAKHGLAEATDDEEGGIRVVDPVLDAHLGRVNGAVHLALPTPKTKPNQKYSRALTQAERTHLCRTGQLPEGVYRIDVSRPMSHPAVTSDVTPAVTPVMQMGDNITDNPCNVTTSSNSSSNSSSTSSSRDVMRDDDGYPDLTPLMTGIPLHEQPRLLNKIRACLVAGHTVHACHQALDDARKGATAGQPPWGLAHHKLNQLAAAPLPVTPAPTPSPTTIYDRPDPTPEVLAIFHELQNM